MTKLNCNFGLKWAALSKQGFLPWKDGKRTSIISKKIVFTTRTCNLSVTKKQILHCAKDRPHKKRIQRIMLGLSGLWCMTRRLHMQRDQLADQLAGVDESSKKFNKYFFGKKKVQ